MYTGAPVAITFFTVSFRFALSDSRSLVRSNDVFL
jgi:hypothetical protein